MIGTAAGATTAALLARTSVQKARRKLFVGRRLAFKADRDTRRDTEQSRDVDGDGDGDGKSRKTRSRHPFWPDDYCRCCCFCSLSLPLSVSLWVSRTMKGTWLIHDRPSCDPCPRTPATLLHAQQPELIVVVVAGCCCCSFWSLQATPFECAESK